LTEQRRGGCGVSSTGGVSCRKKPKGKKEGLQGVLERVRERAQKQHERRRRGKGKKGA